MTGLPGWNAPVHVVVDMSPGGDYEWDAIGVAHDPTADRPRWWFSRQYGCSCNSFEWIKSEFVRMTRAEVIRQIKEWNGGSFGDLEDALRAIEIVQGHDRKS